MTKANSIFDNIIKNENSFTELFYNFLRFEVFRSIFLDLIELNIDKGKIKHSDFDTQYSIAKFGRPDLALLDNEIEILFEIKVYNTSLTPNQPASYYKHLKEVSKKKYKGLILIAPDDYYDLKRYSVELSKINENGNQIFTQVVFWNDIVNQIEKRNLPAISSLFKEYSNFLTSWFQMKSIFFESLNTTTMFGKEFPDSLRKTILIIENLFKDLKKQRFKISRSNDKYFDEYGFEFTLPKEETLFFGIWFDYWLDSGNPICIAYDGSSKEIIKLINDELRLKNLGLLVEFAEWHVTFIDKSTLMDSKSEKIISKLLVDIANNVKAEKVLGNLE